MTILFGNAGCGYFMAGTWEDDPDNWARAFNSTKPDDVIVAHSKYSRFPHFTCEFEYFFHIKANTKLHDQLFSDNDLIHVEDIDEVKQYHVYGSKTPAWFLAKSPEKYDMWRCPDRSPCTYAIFIDKDNNDILVTDRQL
jgi:hypothetical protein